MVKTKIEIVAIAKEYVRRLKDRGIRVEKVLLFGSYGRGTPTDRSDIDLAFISNDFERMNLLERQKTLAACRPGLVRTDVLAYSVRTLASKSLFSPLARQILDEGVPLQLDAA